VRRAIAGTALAFGLAAAACHGPAAIEPSWPELQAKRNEITALWTQIRAWRHEGGMAVEPDDDAVMAMQRTSAAGAARACALPTPPPPRCVDVCEIGGAICDNAEDICAIADELGNDTWAKEKCDSAKASCREAQERCCECDEQEGAP